MKPADVLEEARQRFDSAVDAESELRERMLDDLRFESGEQWDERVKTARQSDPDGPRPCLVLNRARKHKNAIVNDMRQSRPQMRVLPVDDKADPETAEMINGLLRHIQVSSDAELAYDCAAESQVTMGVGYFRVLTRPVRRASNLQEVAITPIRNPFAVYMDWSGEDPSGADANWCFVVEDMSRDEFQRRYPKAELVDWKECSDQGLSNWYPDDKTVRVVEYWCAKEVEATVYETELGAYTQDEYLRRFATDLMPPAIIEQRTETIRQVYWHKLSGLEVLDEAEFPSRYIGVIRVIGEERLIDGKRDWRGIIRDIRDPQRLYNYWASLNAEHIALAPKAPYVGPISAFEGHEDEWARANTANVPYLPYNDRDSNGDEIARPSRESPVPAHMGLINGMQLAAEDIREISGQSQASFGEQSNEKSGRAIMARQREGETNTFHFVDNLQRAVRHAGRVILDMIPRIYDTQRIVRILGEDGQPDFAQIDQTGQAMVEMPAGQGVQKVYDLSIGQYDLVVSVGASYATRRQEALDQMTAIVQANPQVFAVIGDMMVKSMDWPGADDMAERLRALLPPEIQQIEQAKAEGKDQAQAQMAAMQQAIMAQVQPVIMELQQALQAAGQESDEKDQQIAELDAKVREAQIQLRDKMGELQLRAEEIDAKERDSARKYEADMAKIQAGLVESAMAQQPESEDAEPDERESEPVTNITAAYAAQQVMGQVTQTMQSMAEQMAQFMEQARSASQAMSEQAAGMRQELDQVQQQMVQDAQQRDRVQAAVLKFLRTDDESELSRVLN